ncbi:MAG: hypothetical protein QM757_41595 [Paludibaculum sp.]
MAEALLARTSIFLVRTASEDITGRPQFSSIGDLSKWMEDRFTGSYNETLDFPADEASLVQTLGTEWYSKRDPWNRAYLVEFGLDENFRTVTLKSTGPDQRPGTEDDFVAAVFRRSYFLPLHRVLQASCIDGRIFRGIRRLFRVCSKTTESCLRGFVTRGVRRTGFRWKPINGREVSDSSSAGPDRVFQTEDDFGADSVFRFLLPEAGGGPTAGGSKVRHTAEDTRGVQKGAHRCGP